ncbi:hypothetical protein ACFLYO_00740 [Chloroflexota bacterium]
MHKQVIIIILLVAIVAGCTPAVPEPQPGQLLYVTTFDAFNEDWDLYEGELSAQVVADNGNSVLQIGVDSLQTGAFTVMEQPFGDFDLQVDVAQVAGPEDLEAPGFGVIFRHKDNENFYAFMISGDGYYQVVRRLDGVDQELSDWALSPAIQLGQAVNTLRVVGQDDTFKFFVNDAALPLCLTIWNPLVPGECQVPAADAGGEATWSAAATVMELVDDSISQGRIGAGARSFGEAGARVHFDDFLVCGPADEPPVPFRCEETGM